MPVSLDYGLAVRSSATRLNKRPSQSKESMGQMMSKLTHLYLNGKNIDSINDLSFCPNVQVLFLHDNCISKIENLGDLKKLRQLYLQNNKLQRIENLDSQKSLSKLYLNNNCIAVLEGLENNPIEELYIANQELGVGEKILFDARSLNFLKHTLLVLDVTGNCLDSLRGLEILVRLRKLIAANNCFEDISKIIYILSSIPELKDLDLSNNPFTKSPHYKKSLITALHSLEFLDGKEVSETSKVFLQRLRSFQLDNTNLLTYQDVQLRRQLGFAASCPIGRKIDLMNPADEKNRRQTCFPKRHSMVSHINSKPLKISLQSSILSQSMKLDKESAHKQKVDAATGIERMQSHQSI